jgi:hypothetical protein
LDFSVDLNLTVAGQARESSIDFILKSHKQAVKLYPFGEYKLNNEQLAIEMINSSLNRLYQNKLFGSGFPQSPPRDYPSFHTEANYTVVYDSTHVNAKTQ